MIFADENIDARIIDRLRTGGIEVYAVRENHPGISDEQVIALSKDPPRIILTEDKDFGEWVYAHHEKYISVILLRYPYQETEAIIESLLVLINTRKKELFGKFITITPDKIRIRSLK